VLGVVISTDLGLEKHVTNVSATCFYHLRQLRHIQRTLSKESAATLVHAFVMSRVDYCNCVFAEAPKSTTNKLQRVLNAAAGVVSGSWKYDCGLTQLLHVKLHWLDVPERIKYKLSMMMLPCMNGSAPRYLAAHCVPVSATASRQYLRSAASHQPVVPSYRLGSYGRRSSVAGPATWNSLRRHLRDPVHTIPVLDDYSRHFSSQSTSAYSALGAVLALMRYKVDVLLTY